METLRGFSQQLLDGDIDLAEFEHQALMNDALRDIPLTAKAIENVGPDNIPRAAQYRVTSGSFSFLNGKRYSPAKSFWFLEGPKRRRVRNPFSNDSAMDDTYRETGEEVVDLARKIIPHLIEQEGKKAAEGRSKYTKVSVYSDRSTKEIFLGFKVRSTVLRLKSGFESPKAAREYLDESRDEVQAKINEMRAGPNKRGTENRPRSGKDLREGDVTPETFSEVFGFRGVQFGNYVEGPRRQADLNRAYDALMDLSDVLDIPTQALSLNGSLGLAFGARGKGGKGAAAAHYEPGNIVINLTKGGGPGSLAHEWLHALDNYFARQDDAKVRASGKDNDYMSSRRRESGAAREEVYQAWKGVEKAIAGGAFAKRSAEFDKPRSKPYWSKTIEKAARAFERYMIDRLSEKGAINDYLVNIDTTGGAYPTKEEMERDGIHQAFDHLFETIETRETDSGTELYSLASGPSKTLTEEEMKSKPPVRITTVKKKRLGGRSVPEMRKSANAFIKKNLQGKVFHNTDQGWKNISLVAASRLKMASGDRTPEHFEAVYVLPDLIENAVLYETKPDRQNDPKIKAVHRLYAPLRIRKNLYRVKLTVMEKSDGRMIYDHSLTEITAPVAEIRADNRKGQRWSLRPTDAEVNVVDLLSGVKTDQESLSLSSQSPQTQGKQVEEIRKSVHRAWKDIGLSEKKLETVMEIWTEDEAAIRRSGGTSGQQKAQGKTLNGIAYVALTGYDPESTAYHEGFHLLQDMFTDTEQRMMRRDREKLRVLAAQTLGLPVYDQRVKNLSQREIEAYAFEQYRKNRDAGLDTKGLLPAIRRAFLRLYNFLQKMRGYLEGAGLLTVADLGNVEEIFDQALSGRTAYREKGADLRTKAEDAARGIGEPAAEPQLSAGKEESLSLGPAWTRTADVFAGDIGLNGEDIKKAGGAIVGGREEVTGTDAQEKALSRIMGTTDVPTGEEIRNGIQSLKERQGLAMKQGFLDQFAAIEDLERGENAGDLLDASQSAYKASRMTQNLSSVMAAVLRHGPIEMRDGWFAVKKEQQGLEDIFKDLAENGTLRLWKGWAMAKRAQRLMSEGRENLMSESEISALLDLENQYPEFKKVQEKWQKFNDAMLDMAVDAGLISKSAKELWSEHGDYVPFYRILEEGVSGGAKGKKGLANQKSGILSLKGGEGQVNDIIENMVMNLTSLVDRSYKNAAMKRVVDLSVDAGVMTPVAPNWKPVNVSPEQAAEALEDIGVQVTGMSRDQKEEWLKFFDMVPPKDPDVVSVMIDGRPKYFRVNDPMLLNAVTSMNAPQLQGVMKLFRMSKRLLTEGVTLDPGFMMANVLRDTLSAWVTTGQKGFVPGKDSLKGFVKSLREDDSLVSIMSSGGGSGGFYRTDPDDVRKMIDGKLKGIDKKTVLSTPKRIWEAWHKLGSASESANRVALYDAIRKRGGSESEAAFQALDLMDFSMRGNYAAMRTLIEMVPFMNARIQGIYRLYRGAKANPKAFALRGAIISAATLAVLADNWDRPEYEELEDWDKDTYLHFWIDGQHFRLPKPFEVGAIFSTVPERMFRALLGKDDTKKSAEAALRMIADTFALDPTPQLVKPIIEQIANKSFFTKRPIVNLGLDRLEPEAQWRPSTSDTLKKFAKIMPDASGEARSPVRMEHIIRGYFGTLGSYVLSASDVLVRGMTDGPAKPELRIDDIPVIKRFMRADEARTTRYVTEFYELKREAERAINTFREYHRRGMVAEANDLLSDKAREISLYKGVMKTGRAMSDISRGMRQIELDRRMSPEEKRRHLDRLNKQRNELAKRMVIAAPKTSRLIAMLSSKKQAAQRIHDGLRP